MEKIIGKVLKYGDNIDTDRIIPGKYTKTMDLNELAAHAMEDVDPNFREKIKKNNIIVAGFNFGCGSSREQAPIALKKAGVAVVVAKTFARIFYRNAINIGLTLVECDTDLIIDGDEIEIILDEGKVYDRSRNLELETNPMPKMMRDILREGGLVSYLTAHKNYDF